MQRYIISQFDSDTFLVIDRYENREVCVCGNYVNGMDAEIRARQIIAALNNRMIQHPKSRPDLLSIKSR